MVIKFDLLEIAKDVAMNRNSGLRSYEYTMKTKGGYTAYLSFDAIMETKGKDIYKLSIEFEKLDLVGKDAKGIKFKSNFDREKLISLINSYIKML